MGTLDYPSASPLFRILARQIADIECLSHWSADSRPAGIVRWHSFFRSQVSQQSEPKVPVPRKNASLICARSMPMDNARAKILALEPLGKFRDPPHTAG